MYIALDPHDDHAPGRGAVRAGSAEIACDHNTIVMSNMLHASVGCANRR